MRQRWGIFALVVFVVLDIVLVALAFQHTSGSPPPAPRAQAVQTPTADAPASAASETPEAPQTSQSPEASGTPVTGRSADPLAAVTSDGTVLRVTRGSCSDGVPPTAEVSARQGRPLRTTNVDGLSEALAVDAASETDLTVVGLDASCTVTTYTSTDGGGSWSAAAGASGGWYAARRGSTVFSPDGRHRTPCRALSLAPVDDGVARLLCRGGQVSGTSDGGSSWVTLGQLAGARSISFETPGDGVAVARRSDCDAALMRTADGGTSWNEVSCLRGGPAEVVAASGDTVVAQAGDRLQLSTDAGGSWRRVRR